MSTQQSKPKANGRRRAMWREDTRQQSMGRWKMKCFPHLLHKDIDKMTGEEVEEWLEREGFVWRADKWVLRPQGEDIFDAMLEDGEEYHCLRCGSLLNPTDIRPYHYSGICIWACSHCGASHTAAELNPIAGLEVYL